MILSCKQLFHLTMYVCWYQDMSGQRWNLNFNIFYNYTLLVLVGWPFCQLQVICQLFWSTTSPGWRLCRFRSFLAVSSNLQLSLFFFFFFLTGCLYLSHMFDILLTSSPLPRFILLKLPLSHKLKDWIYLCFCLAFIFAFEFIFEFIFIFLCFGTLLLYETPERSLYLSHAALNLLVTSS